MIKIIAAVSLNGVIGSIGKDGKQCIPFRYKEDMLAFKRLTSDQTVIMGRKTFETLGKPLPSRKNIVISNTMQPVDGVHCFPALKAAIDHQNHINGMLRECGDIWLIRRAFNL